MKDLVFWCPFSFCVSPTVNLPWKNDALMHAKGYRTMKSKAGLSTISEIASWRSLVDCAITIQIEFKTRKQTFRCRHGCMEKWILLYQPGWMRNELKRNGCKLYVRVVISGFFGLVKRWLEMSCFECFIVFLQLQMQNYPFNIKAHKIWKATSDGGTPETTVSSSPFPLAFNMLLHKNSNCLSKHQCIQNPEQQKLSSRKTFTNHLFWRSNLLTQGLRGHFDLGGYGYGLEYLTWPTLWHVEQTLSSQASWRLREEDEDKHRLLAKLRNSQTKRLACGIVTMLRCWWNV